MCTNWEVGTSGLQSLLFHPGKGLSFGAVSSIWVLCAYYSVSLLPISPQLAHLEGNGMWPLHC